MKMKKLLMNLRERRAEVLPPGEERMEVAGKRLVKKVKAGVRERRWQEVVELMAKVWLMGKLCSFWSVDVLLLQ